MDKSYAISAEEQVFSEILLEKMDRTPLLIDYFATCGIRQKDLLDYILKLEEAKTPVLPSLQPEILAKNKLIPEVTSRYPPVDKPSFPCPLAIPDFCFPMGYEAREGDENFATSSSFVLTDGARKFTYVSYYLSVTAIDFLSYMKGWKSF